MEFGPDDMVDLGMRYVHGLVFSVVASFVLFFAFTQVRHRLKGGSGSRLGAFLFFSPLVCWTLYFSATFRLNYTLSMLGSESSGAAEWAYENRFVSEVHTVRAAEHLATSAREEPNVRFYAACRIADLLSTNNDASVNEVLQTLSAGPIITTEFFDGNSLTQGLYVPGHEQVQLSVRDIVERRLRLIRNGSAKIDGKS